MAALGDNVMTATCAPENFQKMGGWFLNADVRHRCLDKGYDYLCESTKESILMDLRSISAAEEGRSPRIFKVPRPL